MTKVVDSRLKVISTQTMFHCNEGPQVKPLVFLVVGELVCMDEVNPKNDVFMEVPDDMNGVFEHFGPDLYLKFIYPSNVQYLATDSMAGFGSMVQSWRSLMCWDGQKHLFT